VADLVLTALYSRDMYRSAVHDDDRIAWVVACMLLVELHFDRKIGIGADGSIHPARGASHDHHVLETLLKSEPNAHDARHAAVWLGYLAQHHRAITMVWQRLVNAGVAAPEEKKWRWSRPRRSLTNPLACAWAREYLREHVTAAEVPEPAIALWHGLQALSLDADDLEMEHLDIARRLRSVRLPPALTALFDALDKGLARLATPL